MIFALGSPGEIRAFAVNDGTLTDMAIERPGEPDHFDAVFAATIIARVPAMAGAFLDMGGGLGGFMPDSAGAKHRSAGDRLAVRVTRSAQGGKGPRLAAAIYPAPLPGTGLLTPGPGAVARLATLHPNARILVDDAALLAALSPGLRSRAALGEPDAALLDRAALLESPVTRLTGGSTLTITPTAALVAIDVDAATALGGKLTHEAINRDLLPALALEIRLRNVSGGIVVDFAGMAARARQRLGPALVAALAADPLAPKFLGFSALGFAEIVRARTTPPLHEVLRGPRAALVAALRAAIADHSLTTLTAAPGVIGCADPKTLDDLRRRRAALTLRADPAMPQNTWHLARASGAA